MIKSYEQKVIEKLAKEDPFLTDKELKEAAMDYIKYNRALSNEQLEEEQEYISELISNFRKPFEK